MALLINTRTLQIEWGDCDPAGIVFYPRYFAMFDASTTALFQRALGMTKYEFLKKYRSAGYPMVDTRARFILPARFGDEVTIETMVMEFRRSSFDVRHRLRKGGELAVEGFETRVWVGRDPNDAEKIRAQPLPEEVIASFKAT
jgi:4-hydroxybenzoyl-CoA thioesterase